MITSGIRLGTPAVTTRGLKEADMVKMAHLIHESIVNKDNENKQSNIQKEVHAMMSDRPLFAS
jgi:glycine hydroxymethyltransferase